MSQPQLTERFLASLGGWEAMKEARRLVADDRVLSSQWNPPLLKGVVQDGPTSFGAGLVIKGPIDVDNICSCRAARQWGTLCAHSLAVGLHWLKQEAGAAPPPSVSEPQAAAPRKNSGPAGAARARRLTRRADGEAAELFVLLPPQLEPAIARDKVMLCFEAQWRGGRMPLNALPNTHAYAWSPQDDALLNHVESLAGGETPAVLMLSGREFASLLPWLTEHPRLTCGRSQAARVLREPYPLACQATLLPQGDIELRLQPGGVPGTVLAGAWVLRERTFQPLGWPADCQGLCDGAVRLTREQVPLFLSQVWPQLAADGRLRADFSAEDFALDTAPPVCVLHLKGGLAVLEGSLGFQYAGRVMVPRPGVTDPPWLPDPQAPTRYVLRDLGLEDAARARLVRAGFEGPDAEGRWRLEGQDAVLRFLAREYPRMQREWRVTLEERLERSTRQHLERIEPQFAVRAAGTQWLDLAVHYASSDGERLAPADIQRLILSGRSHTRLRNGKFALLDVGAVEELQEVLRDCAPVQQEGAYRIHPTQAGFLDATLREQGWRAPAAKDWQALALNASGSARPSCPPLGDLESTLRPYQKSGVAWLQFLRVNGFGGILADEMGLGKTLQVLALLNSRAESGAGNSASTPSAPSLVVCPTSLVFNWVAEARHFTPKLRVLPLHGPDRAAWFARMPEAHLVVTSYALLRRDAERYGPIEFDTVILDEAQHIKNRQTQNAQAVKSIRARHRLVLTGTPLENSVLDLWSIFDFLMPDYLGSARDFRERYELPITRDRDARAQARLARRVRPFLLRRLKRDVAPELPPKLEQVVLCDLSEAQRAVYAQLLEAGRREVTEAVGAQGLGRSRMIILNVLLRLRQVCCDLRLLKLDEAEPLAASGKLALFQELLDEALDGGHRALVFSQFVSMLTLLRRELEAQGLPFCYLDGATTDRAGVVTRFQTDSTIPLFLISLKAGGVGLNLTGADTVIHFDPWWNPAVEDQATDRTHRLGQTRLVTSYKLIARGTVEEKILGLQQRKRHVIRAMLDGEEQLADGLTWEEVQELLA